MTDVMSVSFVINVDAHNQNLGCELFLNVMFVGF